MASMKEYLMDYSKGDNLDFIWKLYKLKHRTSNPVLKKACTFLLNRCAHRHGGYIGADAILKEIPSLPHGIHGIYISTFAEIGHGCRIYQNVTIGEVNRKAPVIGDGVLIGAGAVLLGDIKIGNNVKIGAGAVVNKNIPDNCTVVAQPVRIIESKKNEQ